MLVQAIGSQRAFGVQSVGRHRAVNRQSACSKGCSAGTVLALEGVTNEKWSKYGAQQLLLDRTVFHPQGGGQPADNGALPLYVAVSACRQFCLRMSLPLSLPLSHSVSAI